MKGICINRLAVRGMVQVISGFGETFDHIASAGLGNVCGHRVSTGLGVLHAATIYYFHQSRRVS
jgi:hypothetical protein